MSLSREHLLQWRKEGGGRTEGGWRSERSAGRKRKITLPHSPAGDVQVSHAGESLVVGHIEAEFEMRNLENKEQRFKSINTQKTQFWVRLEIVF